MNAQPRKIHTQNSREFVTFLLIFAPFLLQWCTVKRKQSYSQLLTQEWRKSVKIIFNILAFEEEGLPKICDSVFPDSEYWWEWCNCLAIKLEATKSSTCNHVLQNHQKIGKLLARFTKKKRDNTQITKISNEKRILKPTLQK